MAQATTLLREFDFRSAEVPDKMLQLRLDRAALEQGMADAAERFLTIQPAEDGIQPGDIVRVSFADPEAPDGVRQAQFSVGRHFFDPGLEDALPGLCRGQTALLPCLGRQRQVTIVSVKRRRIPPLTDQAVASLGLPGVTTVAGYRRHLQDRAAERKRREREQILVGYLEKQVLAGSEFSPTDRTTPEYQAMDQRNRSMAKEMAAREEGGSEQEALARMLGLKPGAGEQEIETALQQNCDRALQLAALGQAHAARDGVTYTPEECLRQLEQMALQRGIPPQQLQAMVPLPLLLTDRYTRYYQEEILAYYRPKFTVVIE